MVFLCLGSLTGYQLSNLLQRISKPMKKPAIALFYTALLIIPCFILVDSFSSWASPLPSDKPNVLIIIMDTLRSDGLGICGRNDTCSPEIDRYFKDSVQLTDIRSDASWTVPAFASLFTGIEPWQHGVFEGGLSIKPEHKTLAEVYKSNGYATFALMCNPVLVESAGYNRGFDLYYNNIEHRDALDTMKSTIGLIPVLKETSPFFLAVQFMDCHKPYSPSKRFDNRITSNEFPWIYSEPIKGDSYANPRSHVSSQFIEQFRSDYQGSLRDADSAIGNILRKMERAGILSNTIVVVTSDHGEEFREHESLDHCVSLYEEVVQIPLLVKAKQINKKVMSHPGSLSDLGKTILNLSTINSSFGNDIDLLSQNNRHRPIYLDTRRHGFAISGVVVDEFKYIAPHVPTMNQPVFDHYYPRPWKAKEVFKLIDDPKELHPINITKNHEESLRNLLKKSVSDTDNSSWNEKSFDQSSLQALKELGYIH